MVGKSKRKRSADASLAAADSLALPMADEIGGERVLSKKGKAKGGKAKGEATKRIITRKIVLCFSSVILVAVIVLSIFLARMRAGEGTRGSVNKLEGGDNIFSDPKKATDVYVLLEPRVNDAEALLDIETPEGMAFNLLLEERKADNSTAFRSEFYVQRYALLVLYYGTGGEDWTNTTGWSSQTEVHEEWHGVVVEDSVVVGIDLDRNNLQGKIPEDFCILNGLNFLRLRSNMVQLPSCLPKISELHELDFRWNGFFGELPSNLHMMESLKVLRLSNNEFTGSIDTLFGNARRSGSFFPNLTKLDLANNNLSGDLPESILRRLPRLDILILHGNPRLTGSLNEMCKGDQLSEIDADCDLVLCRCCSSGYNCPSSSLLGV